MKSRILVVEDENIVAMDIQNGLKKRGYDVPATVDNGDDAIRLAQEIKPDLILMDVQIKGTRDGIQVAEEIWNRLRIPIIFLTAYADEKTLERAKGPEPFGYILKPFEEAELHTAIEVALRKHHIVQQERLQHLTALAASEKRFQLLVNSVIDYAIVMLDLDGNISSWNEGAERITGYSAKEISGKHFSIFYPEDTQPFDHAQKKLESAAKTGKFQEEGWHVRKDGTRYWVSVVISPIWDDEGRLIGFGRVARDMTDRKTFEERAKFLAEISSVLTYSLDLEITLKELTNLMIPKWADLCVVDLLSPDGKLLGISVAHRDPEKKKIVENFRRKHPPDLRAAHGIGYVIRAKRSELIPEITDEILNEIAEKQNREYADIVRRLGIRSTVSVPLISRDLVLGAMSLVSENPSRLYTQEDLQFIQEIAHKASHAIENSKLYMEAQAAIRARDEFLSVASHELKTPLASLKLQAQITQHYLRKGALSHFTEDLLREFAIQLDRNVDHLTHLVEDMLDIARIQTGRLSAQFERVDLVKLIRDAIKASSASLQAVNCEVKLDLPERLFGTWDASRINQVITNLLSNAMKYGSGRPIHISLFQRGKSAILSVRDEGIGIAKENQDRIFERFERAIFSNEVSGLGLGLYIVREVLRMHGGVIHVKSELGQGADFIIELPLHPLRQSQRRRMRQSEI